MKDLFDEYPEKKPDSNDILNNKDNLLNSQSNYMLINHPSPTGNSKNDSLISILN